MYKISFTTLRATNCNTLKCVSAKFSSQKNAENFTNFLL